MAEPFVSLYGGLARCRLCGTDQELRMGVCFDCAEWQEADIVARLERENRALAERLRRAEAALEVIRSRPDRVCGDFESCIHAACAASYADWVDADAALAPRAADAEATPQPAPEGHQGAR